MKKSKRIYKTFDEEPTFELLMEKFQFHNESVQYHAHIAQILADEIKEKHPEKAKATNYFTPEFFETENEENQHEKG